MIIYVLLIDVKFFCNILLLPCVCGSRTWRATPIMLWKYLTVWCTWSLETILHPTGPLTLENLFVVSCHTRKSPDRHSFLTWAQTRMAVFGLWRQITRLPDFKHLDVHVNHCLYITCSFFFFEGWRSYIPGFCIHWFLRSRLLHIYFSVFSFMIHSLTKSTFIRLWLTTTVCTECSKQLFRTTVH